MTATRASHAADLLMPAEHEFRKADYIFANARATRIKLLVHDGFGVWCATRRLHVGRFAWLDRETAATASVALRLSPQQFDALALGLPWQRLGELNTISRCLARVEPGQLL